MVKQNLEEFTQGEKIVVNRKLLKRLKMDDYREFAIAFGNWCYTTTFYTEVSYRHSLDRLLRQFIQECLE